MDERQPTHRAWLNHLSPDVPATLRRFFFAILLDVLATAALLAVTNRWADDADETWWRLATGLAIGAIFAVAGHLFAESRPRARVVGIVLTYLAPVAVVALLQVRSSAWMVPYALPAIGVLWLSVSAFTHRGSGAEREDIQDRFWWLNQRAITTAVIAAIAFALIAIGTLALERALSTLFGLDTDTLFYRIILPVAGGLLAPIYWLATIPRLNDYDAAALGEPDFLTRAVGFLGQFVLTPLLLAYGVILLTYTAQIVLTQQLPEGTIGWMVLGFAVTGAANWLLLHPAFIRDRAVVRFFRRWWFWLTLPPLALYAVAVYVRIDVYGFTPERLTLVWGGLWATVLSLCFLLRRGDIRLIPALGTLALALMTIGPWNVVNLSLLEQSLRLEALLWGRNADPSISIPVQPVWDAEEQSAALGAIRFLDSSTEGWQALAKVLGNGGIDYAIGVDSPVTVMAKLGYGGAMGRSFITLYQDDAPVDVSATPLLLGSMSIAYNNVSRPAGGLTMRIDGGVLLVEGGGTTLRIALTDWVARQGDAAIVDPWIDFSFEGRTYRFVLVSASYEIDPADAPREVTNLSGLLFGAATPTP